MLLTVTKSTPRKKGGFHVTLVGKINKPTKVPGVTQEISRTFYLTHVKEDLAVGSKHEFSNEDWVVNPVETTMTIEGVETEITMNYLVTKEQAAEAFSRV